MKRPGRMMKLVIGSAISKPTTICYPFVKLRMPDNFRGKLKFKAEMCIGCKLCMKDCPTSAITIRKVADKVFEADIDLSKCIYCAQCVDSCPKKALEATNDFELAQLDRDKLKTVQRGQPENEPEKKP